MEYQGTLYGRVGEFYFPLKATSQEFDDLQKRGRELETENKILREKIEFLEKEFSQSISVEKIKSIIPSRDLLLEVAALRTDDFEEQKQFLNGSIYIIEKINDTLNNSK